MAARAARDAGELDAAQVTAEAEWLGAAVDRLVAGQTLYHPTGGCLRIWPANAARCSPFWPSPGAGDQLARRARHPPRGRLPQGLGGNRTWAGAQTWQVLTSILATAAAQQRDPVALLVPLRCAPGPVLADLAIPAAARVACDP